jgi:hypothetical protein
MEFKCLNIFRKSAEKIQVSLKSATRITGTLYEDHYTLLIICHSILVRLKNVSDKSCREGQNTHFCV